jgi:hypothetical protein
MLQALALSRISTATLPPPNSAAKTDRNHRGYGGGRQSCGKLSIEARCTEYDRWTDL